MGPRAGLDRCGKSRPHRDSMSGPSSPKRVDIPTELSRPTNTHDTYQISKMANFFVFYLRLHIKQILSFLKSSFHNAFSLLVSDAKFAHLCRGYELLSLQ